MPAGKKTVPSMLRHIRSGQARVRIGGRDYYLGVWGSAAAESNYRAVVAEFLRSGSPPSSSRRRGRGPVGLTVTELIVKYLGDLERRGASDGIDKSIKPALRRLRQSFGDLPAADFGEQELRELQRIAARERGAHGERLSYGYVRSKVVGCTKRMFQWAKAEQLVPKRNALDVLTAKPLPASELGLDVLPAVEPAADELIERVLPNLAPMIADMVRLQRLTGARPGEVCAIRWDLIDQSRPVWVFELSAHKTASRGQSRRIRLGPEAQRVLLKYRDVPPGECIFSPKRSEAARSRALRLARVVPITPSQRRLDRQRAENPRRVLGDRFTPQAYSMAIRRVCRRLWPHAVLDAKLKAGQVLTVEEWRELRAWRRRHEFHPHQLRHSAATEAREAFGTLDAAGAMLGHASDESTRRYARRSEALADEVALKIG